MSSSKPNLLFIFTDQQRADTMSAYGNNLIQTPNLNKFSRSCAVFDQAYVTQPVCTPSRSTIMTGQWPHTNGCTENNIPLDTNIPCLPELIDDPDYKTGYMGKWHLGDEIFAQHGFQEWISIDDGYKQYYRDDKDRNAKSTYCQWLFENGFEPENGDIFGRGETARFPEEYSKPAYLANETCRFLKEHAKDNFILYVNFLEPHTPYFGPRDNQHDISSIPLPEDFENIPGLQHPLKTRLFQKAYEIKGISGMPLKQPEDWKKVIRNYWGLCSLVDTYFGKIMAALDEYGLDENTIVVYTSDHGDMMGDHRLIAKCVMFEQALKVPMLLRMPGQKQPRRIHGPMSQIDIVPTLLDLMESKIPSGLQGTSLKNVCVNNEANINRPAFVEWQGHNSGVLPDARGNINIPENLKGICPKEKFTKAITDPVRTVITPEGWKFNSSKSGEQELYNIKQDPFELDNKALDEDYNKIKQSCAELIYKWQSANKDQLQLITC